MFITVFVASIVWGIVFLLTRTIIKHSANFRLDSHGSKVNAYERYDFLESQKFAVGNF